MFCCLHRMSVVNARKMFLLFFDTGAGKSKKLAKGQAAHKLLHSLRDSKPELSQQGSLLEEEDEASTI